MRGTRAALFGRGCYRRRFSEEVEAAHNYQRQNQHAVLEIGEMRTDEKTRRKQSPERRIAETFAIGEIHCAQHSERGEDNAREDVESFESDHGKSPPPCG